MRDMLDDIFLFGTNLILSEGHVHACFYSPGDLVCASPLVGHPPLYYGSARK